MRHFVYRKENVWAIFTDAYRNGEYVWLFHSAHWTRKRARIFAKGFDVKTKVKKITFEVVS